MNNIRFRAWGGDRYYYFDNHHYTLTYNDISGWNVEVNNSGRYVCGMSDSKTCNDDICNFNLEMYTGIKDKNSRDIYVGDIIKTDSGLVGEMYWYKNRVMVEFNKGKVESFPDSWEIEVAGNIHENPELLK